MSKVGQNSTAFKRQTGCLSAFLQNSIRAFQNDLGQNRDVFSFEDIGQSNWTSNCQRKKIFETIKRNVTFILNVISESSIYFTQLSIVSAKNNIDIFT